MSDFAGYEFKVPVQPKFEPPAKPEKEQLSKLDVTLEDLVIQEKKGDNIDDPNAVTADDFRPKKKKSRGRYEDDDHSRNSSQPRYIRIHAPREAIEDLCNSLNVDTNGYYVKMEAVLTKRRQ